MTDPFPREDAFVLSLQLRGFQSHDFWLAGRPARLDPSPSGSFTFVDLNLEPSAYLREPFDSLHFHVPRPALDAMADDEDRLRVVSLQLRSGAAVTDPVVQQLGLCLLPVLEEPRRASRLFLEHIALALLAHVAEKYGGTAGAEHLGRGRLAPWQERRIKDLLMAHLDGDVSLDGIARECGISRSHLIRAFSRSTGLPPHRWLLGQRIERARQLLLDTDSSIAEIASRLGFADQSHLTRVFGRVLGCTPGALRRTRAPRADRVVHATTPPYQQALPFESPASDER